MSAKQGNGSTNKSRLGVPANQEPAKGARLSYGNVSGRVPQRAVTTWVSK